MTAIPRSSQRTLLACGIVAGPFYLALGLAQALLREGFDLGRHSLSALANGPGGWIQTANFVVSGALVLAAAIGVGRALRPHSRLAGWILSLFGVGMLVASVFRADPVDGFPPGTPDGFPSTLSTSGVVHFAAGATGFLALAAAAIAVGIAFLRRREKGLAMLSFVAGVCIVAGFFAPMFLPSAGPVAGIWFSVVIGWAWLALICAHLRRAG